MAIDLSRVGSWYHGYIKLVDSQGLDEAFMLETAAFTDFLDSIPEEKHDHAYAEGKWTIKEVLQHIIDAERVFAYRALCIGRMDKTPLPSFDENMYAMNADAARRDWSSLRAEFDAVRLSTRLLFESFSEAQLESDGVSSNAPMYTRALGYIVLGHAKHHEGVTRERYF